MNPSIFFSGYLSWHYGSAFLGIFQIWKNILWFVTHFFSLRLLVTTFFAPWRRLHEEKGEGFNPKELASALLINTIMRIVGAVNRSLMIILALLSLFVVLIGGIIFFIIWLALPLVIFLLFVSGLRFII